MERKVPQIFDFVKSHRAYQRGLRLPPARFLLEAACLDLEERLAPVLREFSSVVDFGTPFGAFGESLRRFRPQNEVKIIPSMFEQSPEEWTRLLAQPDLGLGVEQVSLLLSGFFLHAVDDVPGLLLRLRRALRPDGLMIAAFPGGDTLFELRDCLLRAESEERGAAGLRVFPMIDWQVAGQLLQRAGFTLPVVDKEKTTVRYPNFLSLIHDLRAMGTSANALYRAAQPSLTRAILRRASELYVENYSDADGRLRATFEIIWLSGWAEHESQQRPAPRGSAKVSLAEALRPKA